MSQNDRLIPHELFERYRRRFRPDRKDALGDSPIAPAQVFAKEMLLRKLHESREKIRTRLDEIKRLRKRLAEESDNQPPFTPDEK